MHVARISLSLACASWRNADAHPCQCSFWTLSDSAPTRWHVPEQPLPSDVRCRRDLASLAEGDMDGAQHWKEVLEQQQRADRKLREAAGVYEH